MLFECWELWLLVSSLCVGVGACALGRDWLFRCVIVFLWATCVCVCGPYLSLYDCVGVCVHLMMLASAWHLLLQVGQALCCNP